MIELSQAPVNEPQPPVLVIDHHVVGLDVSVHDPHAVTVVQSPQQLVQIKSEKIVIKVMVTQKDRVGMTCLISKSVRV